MTTDPAIGPLLMFGLGGIYVEVMKDVQFKIAPITDSEARELVRGIKGFKLLEGTRGEAPADIRAAEETLQRISQLITDFHEILEMDLNPFVLLEKGNGGVALDGRVTIALD
jgi:acetyltransferase